MKNGHPNQQKPTEYNRKLVSNFPFDVTHTRTQTNTHMECEGVLIDIRCPFSLSVCVKQCLRVYCIGFGASKNECRDESVVCATGILMYIEKQIDTACHTYVTIQQICVWDGEIEVLMFNQLNEFALNQWQCVDTHSLNHIHSRSQCYVFISFDFIFFLISTSTQFWLEFIGTNKCVLHDCIACLCYAWHLFSFPLSISLQLQSDT